MTSPQRCEQPANVTIVCVPPGSHADTAGLFKADSIVRINGQNVSRSSADSVAKIVK